MSRTTAQVSFLDEIIVDSFAGGGGASTGIELATGRPVTIAINHDPDAILMHKTNHPYTEHYQASVWDVDPRRRIGGDLANGPGEDGTERAGGGVRRLGRGRLSPPGGGTDPPKPADQHTGPGGHDPSRRKGRGGYLYLLPGLQLPGLYRE